MSLTTSESKIIKETQLVTSEQDAKMHKLESLANAKLKALSTILSELKAVTAQLEAEITEPTELIVGGVSAFKHSKHQIPKEVYDEEIAKLKEIPAPIFDRLCTYEANLSEYLTKVWHLEVTEADIVNVVVGKLPKCLRENLMDEIDFRKLTEREYTVSELQMAVREFSQRDSHGSCRVLKRLQEREQDGSLRDYVDYFDELVPHVFLKKSAHDQYHRTEATKAFLFGLEHKGMSDEALVRFIDVFGRCRAPYPDVKNWVLNRATKIGQKIK